MADDYQICNRCVMDTTDPDIQFDAHGVCYHCSQYVQMVNMKIFPGEKGKRRLEEIVKKIKLEGINKKYDCIIGVSGGLDSTYVAVKVKEFGLRPLAVHLDNGWNSELAVKNIEKILKKLEIDLYTYVINWEEFKDIQLSFLKASTADSEIPSDHAIFSLLYQMAEKMGVQYVITGINVRTESHLPGAWSRGHFDWKYIKSVHKKFGHRRLDTFPHMDFWTFRRYRQNIQWVNILDYLDYVKKDALRQLEDSFGWKYYGWKHHESIYTRFYQGYILPKKFGFDKRKVHLSSLICSGEMTRADALEELKKEPYPIEIQEEDKTYVIKKLGLTHQEFEKLMSAPKRVYWEYPSYERLHKTFFYKCYFRVEKLFNYIYRRLVSRPSAPFWGRNKVLVLVEDIPSIENPHIWKHALDQAIKVSELCEISVVFFAPLRLKLTSSPRVRHEIELAQKFECDTRAISYHCLGYIDIMLVPWKFRAAHVEIWAKLLSLMSYIIYCGIDFDILHAHFVYKSGYIAAILGKIFNKPVVITTHGSDIHCNLLVNRENRLLRKRSIYALKQSLALIAVSDYLKAIITKEGFGEKTHTIPCGYLKEYFFPRDKRTSRAGLLLSEEDKIILFVGNLTPIKGADILLTAFTVLRKEDPKTILLIVGNGPERETLRRQASNLGVIGSVQFFGVTPPSSISLYMSAADVVVVPSRDEGRSLVAMEALACGRPVVASCVGGIPETIINDNLGVLVEKEDPAALVCGIKQALARKWDEAYMLNYVDKYSDDKIAQNVQNVYDKMLKKR